MPPCRGGICGRLTEDLPSTQLQGGKTRSYPKPPKVNTNLGTPTAIGVPPRGRIQDHITTPPPPRMAVLCLGAPCGDSPMGTFIREITTDQNTGKSGWLAEVRGICTTASATYATSLSLVSRPTSIPAALRLLKVAPDGTSDSSHDMISPRG